MNYWNKGGISLEAGHGIFAPIFRFHVRMTWKIDITEGLDVSKIPDSRLNSDILFVISKISFKQAGTELG